MDRKLELAMQLEIAWTVKHGKNKDYRNLLNRLTHWLFDEEAETEAEVQTSYASKRPTIFTGRKSRHGAAPKNQPKRTGGKASS